MTQANSANTTITTILQNAPTTTEKGTIDSRYLWPTLVFEYVCICSGNYYGANCSECAFGWKGDDCQTQKRTVVRRSFNSLTTSEKQRVVNGLQSLKNEVDHWTIIDTEPATSSGRVTLQEVSTYDFLVYIHNYAARDASAACQVLNGALVDFAHSGPNFPVWHRTFLLVLERAMQRVLRDETFGFPYWTWESNDRSPFDAQYLGSLSSSRGSFEAVNGTLLENWRTVCDSAYQNGTNAYFSDETTTRCTRYWALCNPQSDLTQNRKLERGKAETYLPSLREIQMALEAPAYDAPNYRRDNSEVSFRSRLEGWSMICSASNCVGRQLSNKYQRMHNNIHDWIGGHMAIASGSVNDPIFSLHHTNVDRILESWMKKFQNNTLPEYEPESGGHPGHNKNDYMVPFFPLIKPGDQYSMAENWGYEYDNLIQPMITDIELSTCIYTNENIDKCNLCTADSSDCTCYRNGSYRPCTCLENEKNRCLSTSPTNPSRPTGSSSSKLKASQLLLSLVALFSILGGYFSL